MTSSEVTNAVSDFIGALGFNPGDVLELRVSPGEVVVRVRPPRGNHSGPTEYTFPMGVVK